MCAGSSPKEMGILEDGGGDFPSEFVTPLPLADPIRKLKTICGAKRSQRSAKPKWKRKKTHIIVKRNSRDPHSYSHTTPLKYGNGMGPTYGKRCPTCLGGPWRNLASHRFYISE